MRSARDVWSRETFDVMSAAGWFEGRDVVTLAKNWIAEILPLVSEPMPSTVQAILREFGGLRAGSIRPGVVRACAELSFSPLEYGPDEGILQEHSRIVGQAVFPVGAINGGEGMLASDADGRVYLLGEMDFQLGPTIYHAVECALRGLAPIAGPFVRVRPS